MFPMECSFWACLITYEKVNIKFEIYTTITFYPIFFLLQHISVELHYSNSGLAEPIGQLGQLPFHFL